MIIGVLTMEIDIGGAFSLKEKRMTINRIRDRVRAKFNVGIAEVDDLDLWNHACMAAVAVSNEQAHVNAVLSKVVDLVHNIRDCDLEDYSIEFI